MAQGSGGIDSRRRLGRHASPREQRRLVLVEHARVIEAQALAWRCDRHDCHRTAGASGIAYAPHFPTLADRMSPLGTEGELRASGGYGRNLRDFCRSSQAGSTRSIDPNRQSESLARSRQQAPAITHARMRPSMAPPPNRCAKALRRGLHLNPRFGKFFESPNVEDLRIAHLPKGLSGKCRTTT
jgi:hypothetical protein